MSDLILRREQFLQTKEHFIKAYSITNVINMCRGVTTINKALAKRKDFATLAEIKKKFSDEFVTTYIEMWIQDLNDYLNVKRKMTAGQRQQTSIFIYEEFYYYSLAEINLIFTKIKKGEFGSFYESIDGTKIISCFKEFDKERDIAIEQEKQAEEGEHKNIYESVHPDILEKLKEVTEKVDLEKRLKKDEAVQEYRKIVRIKYIRKRRKKQIELIRKYKHLKTKKDGNKKS